MSMKMTRTRKIRLIQAVILATVVLVIEYITRANIVGPTVLLPPSEIAITLINLLASGSLFNDIFQTALSVFVAFLLATGIGIPIGWILWNWNILQRILDPYLISLYAAPIFVFYPMLIVIFGLNRIPIILIAFLISIAVIIINSANGFGQIPDVYVDVGRSLGLSRFKASVHIYFPAAAPNIFTGLKLGFVYALIGVIASEFILANSGLGFQVSYNYDQFDTGQMYAGMLLVVLLAVFTGIVLTRIENRLYRRSVSE